MRARVNTHTHAIDSGSPSIHPACLLKGFEECSLAVGDSRTRTLLRQLVVKLHGQLLWERRPTPEVLRQPLVLANNAVDCVCRNVSAPTLALIIRGGGRGCDLLLSGSKISSLCLFALLPPASHS